MSQHTNIAFVGAGNMATAIISGLIANKTPGNSIWASNPRREKLDRLVQQYHIHTSQDNSEVVKQADIVVLAVKPQILSSVVQELAPILIARKPLIMSIAVGITTASIHHWLGERLPLIRCMPNTPALIGSGASVLYATSQVTEEQKTQAEHIMRAVGISTWLDHEHQVDTMAAISGSGPAYFFRLMELIANWGQNHGIDPALAQLYITQTALGSAQLALKSDSTLNILRQQVTSPGGTTEQALKAFEQGDLEKLVNTALDAAKRQAEKLNKELGV